MGKITIGNSVRDETAKEIADRLAQFASPPTTVADYQAAIQALIDQTAVSKQYADGVTLASYAVSTNGDWKAQSLAFIAWRDAVWTYVYGELAMVQAGQRTQPTIAAFLAELPVISWPGV